MRGQSAVTRFAPSPTGFLHTGHGFAALFAWRAAREAGGRFLLRIEDIDQARCRSEYEAALAEDLRWLGTGLPGFAWEQPVRRQSEHMADYRAALDELARLGLVYPCFCTRAQVLAEIKKSGGAPHGAGQFVYPGTCRALSPHGRERRIAEGRPYALRLNVAKASARVGKLRWHDRGRGTITAAPEVLGDVVVARKETPTSYHLAATLDDHIQGVTLVTRGEDLFEATHVHRLLQALLGLRTPDYWHHPLLKDESGARLAKRDGAPSLRALRFSGRSPAEIRAKLGFADAELKSLPMVG